MGKIERFEELMSWQKARELNHRVYEVSRVGPWAKDVELRSQIRGASISIMSNIAEGFERGGNKELMQFLSIAKGSCGEVRSQLYAALDEEYITMAQFEDLLSRSVELSRLISGFVRYLKRSELRGNKFTQQPNP